MPTEIYSAIRFGDIETVKRLLIDPNVTALIQPLSLLYWACFYNHIEIVNLLLNTGINPDRSDGGRQQPLWTACYHNRIEMVKVLLYAGANPNISLYGRTLLHNMPKDDHLELTELLLCAGADPTIPNGPEDPAVEWRNALPDIKPELLENLEQKRMQWLESLPPGSKPWLLKSVSILPGRRTKACRN